MKFVHFTTVLLLLSLLIGVSQPQAEVASIKEAAILANNWIKLVTDNTGGWGGAKDVSIEQAIGFEFDGRQIGFFFRVKPQGYIIVSLLKELAPIKAYSTSTDMDPYSDEGIAELTKLRMSTLLKAIEALVGPIESASDSIIGKILEINHRDSWAELLSGYPIQWNSLSIEGTRNNYQEDDVLLSSHWHQEEPYNNQCPTPPIFSDCNHSNCYVGCSALAGAQIMRYWCWPPYGYGSVSDINFEDYYDWSNMPDALTTSSPDNQINAVAELCHEVGVSFGGILLYCAFWEPDPCASGAIPAEGWFENHHRYASDCTQIYRNQYSQIGWFSILKSEFNANRPVMYSILKHSIVGDGWREIGSEPLRQYHFNYGLDDYHDQWYTLDALYYPAGGSIDDESMFIYAYPDQSLGSEIGGTYTTVQTFPYRYFDQDATSTGAVFANGQYLQFLPGISVTCVSNSGGSVRFESAISDGTRLFTGGDISRGIFVMNNGVLKLSSGGSLKLH